MSDSEIKGHLHDAVATLWWLVRNERWADLAVCAQAIKHYARVLDHSSRADEAGVVKGQS